jgi:hypothetical protein
LKNKKSSDYLLKIIHIVFNKLLLFYNMDKHKLCERYLNCFVLNLSKEIPYYNMDMLSYEFLNVNKLHFYLNNGILEVISN